MARKPINLNLSGEDIFKLYYVVNDNNTPKDYIIRCLILLMSYQGFALKTIADNLNISKTTANRWRQSFVKYRWNGIGIKKAGRPKKIKKHLKYNKYHIKKSSKISPIYECDKF